MKTLIFQMLFLIVCFLPNAETIAQTNLFVSPNGNDNNEGTMDSPLRTLIGARDRVRDIKAQGLNSGEIVVNFRAGRYPVVSTCNLDARDSGTDGNPIIYRGYADEEVIFDGSLMLNSSDFKPTGSSAANKLHPSAVGNIVSQKISDPNLIDALKVETAQISMNDKMMTLARFPNIGFGHIDNTTIDASGESINTKGSESTPRGARFKMVENINAEKWSEELSRTKNAIIVGYVSADWKKESLRISKVESNGTITLMDGSSYGIKNRNPKPNRFFASHLLCELDEPGEWYFDSTDNNLYLWPFEEITDESKIGIWAGPQLVTLVNCEYISFEHMTIQCLGKGKNGDGAINFLSGSNLRAAGVTFRYIAAPLLACNIWSDVSNSAMQSCNFFDIWNCTRLYGGSFTSDGNIIEGNNKIENCHFTQIYSKDFYGKACGMNGVGNIFRNNLIHNMNGQPITHAGIDHLIELNEVFNVGIEEGDGGAFYTGNDVMSYGNVIKHNFVHHIMSVPKLLGRAAFFSDDYDGGETMIENVVYKGGWESLKMNKGAGHHVERNVILDCYTGIRQGNGGTSGYNSSMEYINSTNGKNPLSKDKNNYIGRMLQKIGVLNWQVGLNESNWYSRIEPFWKNRYPEFDAVMKAYSDNNKMSAYECHYNDNLFWSNKNNVYGGGSPAETLRSQSIDLSIFENPDNLNFKFNGSKPAFAPDIPFENIGLYPDSYRCAVPNKEEYRAAIKNHFYNLPCHTGDSYDPATINDRLYYNTGKIVMSTVKCGNSYKQTEFYFDLGTNDSKLFPKYERLTNTTVSGFWGWTNTDNLDAVDRGSIGGINDLNRDLIYSSQPKTLEVTVPNGAYMVLITFGDVRYSHDKIMVKAEGEVRLSNINTENGAKSFFNKTFVVQVTDGKLTLEFSDEGGTDPNWVATRIIIKKENPVSAKSVEQETDKIIIFPNPAGDFMNIWIKNSESSLKNFSIVDLTGKTIQSGSFQTNRKQISLNNLKSGIYLLRIQNKRTSEVKTFIKK